ncbi:MAG: sugar phosphate isomerase/epimerase [Firmicutes bacterium]|nr:sugar phosphate isomerase/epimerase [Bacillota bacterium]
MELGVMVRFVDENIESKFRQVNEFGFESCQLDCWHSELMTPDNAEKIRECCEKYSVHISTFWCGWSGPAVWDFYEGPLTLGIVPAEYRFERMKELMHGSDFAKLLGVKNMATHAGFLPEVPAGEQYHAIVAALKNVAGYVKNNGQYFLFETGQETPVTLRRTIEDVGTGNLGINLDPANLIMYGKANPTDALDAFGKYVRDVHAKDGCYPTDGRHLGKEMPLGQGKVNFPKFIDKLRSVGYDGTLTIEREISGERQINDIKDAKKLLEGLI